MKILITAGPTREPIDPVRYLSNRSSGKMGYAIAAAACAAGHEVMLVSGPVALTPPTGVQTIQVVTSDEMFDAVHSRVAWADVCVLCAAVADFRPATVAPLKIKKGERESFTLELIPTRDILFSLRGRDQPIVVGFAAETDSVLENAQRKLHAKGCALLIVNDVSRTDVGFESEENELTLLFANGDERVLHRANKNVLACALVEIFEDFFK